MTALPRCRGHLLQGQRHDCAELPQFGNYCYSVSSASPQRPNRASARIRWRPSSSR